MSRVFRSQPFGMVSSKSSSSSLLTEDILIEIFAYLPLNSKHKLKCLSKVWLFNLSTSNFIVKWFQINNKSLPWILYYTIRNNNDDENPLKFKMVYPDSHSQFMRRNEHLFSFKFLINKKPFQGAKLYLLGSSNGLVFCYSVDSYERRRYHVCNPLAQTWVSLPEPPCSGISQFDVHGIFCEYSSSFQSCYKVVRIPILPRYNTVEPPEKKFNVDLFCSYLGRWESFEVSCDENIALKQCIHKNVVIHNGVLYLIMGWNRMLVYKLNQNNGSDGHSCSLINLPYGEFDPGRYSYSDSILGESEGRVYCARTRWTRATLTLSVWRLDVASWKVLHNEISIDDILAVLCFRTGDPSVRIHILGFSPVDHNVVLLGYNPWVWGFNIETRSHEELCLDNRHTRRAGMILTPFVLKPVPTSTSTALLDRQSDLCISNSE